MLSLFYACISFRNVSRSLFSADQSETVTVLILMHIDSKRETEMPDTIMWWNGSAFSKKKANHRIEDLERKVV